MPILARTGRDRCLPWIRSCRVRCADLASRTRHAWWRCRAVPAGSPI